MDAQSPAVPRPPADGSGLAGITALLLGPSAAGAGGLHGLATAFEQAGLGERFASWVRVGPNLPVSGVELARALGPSLAAMASAAGTDPDRLADGLASVLPRVIDGLTPAGRLPAPGRIGTLWSLARLLLSSRRRVAP